MIGLVGRRRFELKFFLILCLLTVCAVCVLTSCSILGKGIIEYDFEDSDRQGWISRGDGVRTEVVQEEAHSGKYSLKTSNRTADRHGPSLDLTGILRKNVVYDVVCYVKLIGESAPTSTFKITMEQKQFGASTSWKTVAQAPVQDGQWVKLSGEYSYSEDYDKLLLSIVSENAADAYYIDRVTIKGVGINTTPVGSIEEELPALRGVYADYFTIGAAVEPEQLTRPESQLLKKHYNVIVAEHVMKPVSIQPLEGDFSWASADRIVNFAQDNGMEVRYHTLVWHQQCSDWFFLDEDGKDMTKETDLSKRAANKELLLRRLEQHITAIVERYKDRVKYWNVVNEVIDPAEPDGMRRSKWYQISGTDYIETAFHTARRVGGPNIKLYINDYNTTDPAKRDLLYNFVKELLAKGVPIDGVGHQAHVDLQAPSIAALSASIKLFAGLGLDNQLTEMDVSVYTNSQTSYHTVPQELIVQQGHRYQELFDELKELKDYISNVTFWGIADNHSWLHNCPIPRRDAPFAFDREFKAKPAYWGMVDPEKLPFLTQKLNVVMGEKVIDGVEETVWKTAPWIRMGMGAQEARFKVAWAQELIYVFVDVPDATVHEDDQVAIFIDENNDKAASVQKDDQQIIFKRNRKEVPGVTYRFQEYDGGYRLEASIPARRLSLEQEVGFDLRITDGARNREPVVISWNDITHSQERDTSKYGVLQLKRDMKLTEALPGTPVIDGELDPIWAQAKTIATETVVQGTKQATALVRTLWNEEYLHVWAEVTDPLLNKDANEPHEQDSMEFFIDENNARTITYEADDAQYRVNFDNLQTFGSNGLDDRFQSAAKITTDGYIVEAAIPFKTIKGDEGVVIGFDIQINDADDSGRRQNVVTWYDPIGNDYRDTSYFGCLLLSAKNEAE
jgi:endo-1,4-beta-xylanase